MTAINERLLIAAVRQQEHAQDAREAERRAEAALAQLKTTHTALSAMHEQLQAALAEVKAAYERERRIADTLQRSLMLEVPEDAFPGLSVATLYESALAEAEVGGDFFDIFALSKGRVAVAIADASGKGLAAAVRTIQLKDVLRAFTREYPHSTAAIVARLNDFLCNNQRFDLDHDEWDHCFSCLSLAIIDPESGDGALVTAGCEPALIVRANGASEILELCGIPLGIRCEELYAVNSFHLMPGDTLILVTDGITEARAPRSKAPPNLAFLEYEGMTALAKQGLAQPLPSLRDAGAVILNGARAFGGGALRDDACVVLVRRH